jgi:ornithine cyclodeaminase/alanine dehydrogenase-like protein (mu-crystallin family)
VEAGDLLLAFDDSHWAGVTELKNLVAEPSRAAADGRVTVFKSVGMGMEDVAAAAHIYERAAD